jgi:hypothetical protein
MEELWAVYSGALGMSRQMYDTSAYLECTVWMSMPWYLACQNRAQPALTPFVLRHSAALTENPGTYLNLYDMM